MGDEFIYSKDSVRPFDADDNEFRSSRIGVEKDVPSEKSSVAGKISAQELLARAALESDLDYVPAEQAFAAKKESSSFRPNSLHFWAYSVATTIGGSFYGWNAALRQGFGSFIIGLVLSGLSFVVLSCSLSEIISSTGFSGGAYGMTRVVSGFYMGFITAFLEVAEYITYISMSVLFMGDFIQDQFDLDEFWVPILWIPFYIISFSLLVEGKRVYWNFVLILALFSLAVAAIYILGYLKDFNMMKGASLGKNKGNASDLNNWFYGGMIYFVRYLPYTTWFFGGMETTSLMTDMMKNPKTEFPRSIISASLTLFAVAMAIPCVAVSMLSCIHEVRRLPYFMDYRFGKIGISSEAARWLIFPGQFSMAFGFILPAGNLLHSMAKSQFLPTWLSLRNEKTHHKAILVACVCSYLLCLVSHFVPHVNMVDIPILFGYLTYLVDMYSFSIFKINFFTLKREFESPFGLVGAAFAASMFALGAISIIFYQQDKFTAIYVAGFIAVLSVYYFVYVRKIQTFSNDETKSFLTLHMIKYNSRRKNCIRKGKTASIRTIQRAASTPRIGRPGNATLDEKSLKHCSSSQQIGGTISLKPVHTESDSTMSVNSTSLRRNLSAMLDTAASPMSMFRRKVVPLTPNSGHSFKNHSSPSAMMNKYQTNETATGAMSNTMDNVIDILSEENSCHSLDCKSAEDGIIISTGLPFNRPQLQIDTTVITYQNNNTSLNESGRPNAYAVGDMVESFIE